MTQLEVSTISPAIENTQVITKSKKGNIISGS